MDQKNIMHYIRMCQLKRIVFPLGLLLVVCIIFFRLPIVEYVNIASVGETTPLSQAVNEGHTYVRTEARGLYYTGDDYYVDGALTGHYYYELRDGYCRFYILKPSAGKPAEAYIESRVVTGKLTKSDRSTEALTSDFANTLGWSQEGLNTVTDTYLINEVVYFPAEQKVLFGLLVFAMLISLVAIFYMLVILLFPKLSVTYLRLRNYGDAEKILNDAEKEIADSCILRQSNMVLTPKYLLEYSSDVSALIPLESVLWVFPLQNLRFSLRERRKKMVYALCITTIAGDNFILKNKKKEDIDKVTEVLTDRYPNFFYGYSEEHDKMVHYLLAESKKELKEKKRKS